MASAGGEGWFVGVWEWMSSGVLAQSCKHGTKQVCHRISMALSALLGGFFQRFDTRGDEVAWGDAFGLAIVVEEDAMLQDFLSE